MRYRLAFAAGLIVLTGCGSTPSPQEPTAPAASQAPVQANPQSVPVAVEIPSLGVDSSLLPVGLNSASEVDTEFPGPQAAWYRYSVEAGEVGPLVLLGHVDLDGAPAVFSRLSTIEPGAVVAVRGIDRRTYTYVIDRVESFPKDEFPTGLVYNPTTEPVIRLVTCGGDFGTERAGHYDDNVIAFGRLSDVADLG